MTGQPENESREYYHRLIGVLCAAVPQVYAAHSINQDQLPDLDGYLELLGKETD